ncbi:hypothetical protein INR49_011634, partial [Caranx melampygus]
WRDRPTDRQPTNDPTSAEAAAAPVPHSARGTCDPRLHRNQSVVLMESESTCEQTTAHLLSLPASSV